jgi:hypothetical protein
MEPNRIGQCTSCVIPMVCLSIVRLKSTDRQTVGSPSAQAYSEEGTCEGVFSKKARLTNFIGREGPGKGWGEFFHCDLSIVHC